MSANIQSWPDPTEPGTVWIEIGFRCDRCPRQVFVEGAERHDSPARREALLASAEGDLVDRGWEVRPDGHRCPHCRRMP